MLYEVITAAGRAGAPRPRRRGGRKHLAPAPARPHARRGDAPGDRITSYNVCYTKLLRIKQIKHIEFIDQNPIGKSSRSNPATYLKAYDEIRKLLSDLQSAKQNNLKPSHFSFNVDGGRCDECQGEGTIKVEMQFMADIVLLCESCNGHRFKEEVLDIKYNKKNIHDILELTVEEALQFFAETPKSTEKRRITSYNVCYTKLLRTMASHRYF